VHDGGTPGRGVLPTRAEPCGVLPSAGSSGDQVAVQGALLGHRLLRRQQRVVRLCHGRQRRPPPPLGGGCRGQRRVDILACGPVTDAGQHGVQLGELVLLPGERRHLLGLAGGDRLGPPLETDERLAGRLAGGRRGPRGLLGLPVAPFGDGDRLAPRRLRRPVRLERPIRGGSSATSLAQGGACGLFAATVRRQEQRTRPGAERVVLLLVLRLQREATDLRLELADQVADPRQVVERSGEAAGGLVAAHLEPLDAGRLFE
jgi:hypothetical protein